jgi:hypothetical protein
MSQGKRKIETKMRRITVRRTRPVTAAHVARRAARLTIERDPRRELVGAMLSAQHALSDLAMRFCNELVRSGVLKKAPERA